MLKPISTAFAALVVVSLSLAPGRAWSQPSKIPTRAAAKALYDLGVALMDSGKYDEACPKIEQALQIYPESIGAQVTRGDCYKEWGRFASAVRAYATAMAAAKAAGDVDREKKARERGEESAAKASTLTIVIPEAVASLPGLVVMRDGEAVERKEWGAPVPVDGGTYRIRVAATGKRPRTDTVEVSPSEAKVTVKVDALEDVEAPAPSPAPPSPPAYKAPVAPQPPPPPARADGSGGSGLRVAGFAVGALGAAGAAVGSYFGLRSKSRRDESRADDHCVNGNQCDEIGAPLLREAVAAGDLSTGFFVAGAGLLAGGIVMILVPSSAPAAPSASVALGPGRIELRGRW